MRLANVVAHRVRIDPRQDVHPERAAARDERSERVRVAEPAAPVVQRDFRGIVRDDTAGAQCCSIGMETPEVIQPELRLEVPGIVLDERELDPPHRAIEPFVGCRSPGRVRRMRSSWLSTGTPCTLAAATMMRSAGSR